MAKISDFVEPKTRPCTFVPQQKIINPRTSHTQHNNNLKRYHMLCAACQRCACVHTQFTAKSTGISFFLRKVALQISNGLGLDSFSVVVPFLLYGSLYVSYSTALCHIPSASCPPNSIPLPLCIVSQLTIPSHAVTQGPFTCPTRV